MGNKDTHPHLQGLSSQASIEHLLFSPHFTAKGNELVRGKGGHLATGWGQLTTSNKFPIRNGRDDFQRSSLLFLNLSRRGCIGIMESLRLEILPGSSSPTFDQIPPCSLNRITKCLVDCFLNTCSPLEQ